MYVQVHDRDKSLLLVNVELPASPVGGGGDPFFAGGPDDAKKL